MANKITHFLFNFAIVNILPTFTTSNDSEHNHLHHNKRTRIMKRIRFLYLVALLLMVALGAKADALAVTSADIGKVICTDGSIYATQNDAWYDSKTPVAMIAYADTRNGKALAIALSDAYYYSNDQYKCQFQWAEAEDAVDAWVTENGYSVTFDNATWKVPSIQEWQQMLIGCGAEGTVSDSPSDDTFTFAGLNDKLDNVSGDALQYSHWSATEYSQNTDWAWVAYFYSSLTYACFWGTEKVSDYGYAVRACLAFDIEVTEQVTVYEGLKITTADIGKFICPDGSIYDTWSAADNAGKNAIAMIAHVDAENHRALGFALYGDAPCRYWADAESTINSWADLPDYELTSQYLSWKLPTIQEWQQMFIGCGATGTVTDNPTTMSYSELKTTLEAGNCGWPLFVGYYYYWTATEYDNDNARTVRFSDDGTATFGNEEKTNTWGVQTYVSPCLSIAVYGETQQQPEPEPLSLRVTTDDLGKVVCTDGSLYATVTEATDAGKTPAGMIAYVDMELETGLAIALADESEEMQWQAATDAAAAHAPAIEGTTWKLPSMEEWQQMLVDTGSSPEHEYSSDQLNTWLNNVGGSQLQSTGYTYNETLYPDYYWTSTITDGILWRAQFANDLATFIGMGTEYNEYDYYYHYARACFAFNVKLTKYPITIDSNYASYVQSNKTEAAEGETVGLTITNIPEGQYVEYVSVVKADDSSESVYTSRSIYDDNVFTFTMPAYPVTVDYVYFMYLQEAQLIDGLYYTLNNRTATAEVAPHPNNEYSGAITIPATVHGRLYYNVTAIGREAFAGYSNGEISSVTFGDNVTTVRRDAFYNTTLQSLTMNEGLTTIEQYAFRNGNFPIAIPSTVNDISRWAFKGYKGKQMSVAEGNTTYDSRLNCNAIVETASNTIVAGCDYSAIPNTVTAIGEAAFDGVGLTAITIPANIKILDTGAFANNPLTSVTIPATVETIYTNPFYGCNQLQSIVVEDGNPNYDSRNNCNAICDKQKRWVISTSKNTVIPATITGIGTHAFAYRDDLNEYKVPAHITWIADNAFAYSNLYNVSMADNDDLYIGQWAFQQCGELRTMKIGRGIRNINQQVFKGCPNLSHIYVNAALPPKVKNYTFEIDDAGNTYSGKVHVPSASLKTYKKANFWKDLDLVASDGLQGVKAAFKQKKNGNATARGMKKTLASSVDLITEEGTIWQASYTGSDPFSFTTHSGESCMQIDNSPVSFSNKSDEGFTISGSVKQIVVRAAGNVSNITCEIVDISTDADNEVADQTQSVAAAATDDFDDYTLAFSGKEYSKAKVNVVIEGQSGTYLSSISIIQGGGDYVIVEADQITVNGIDYSNTLNAPASEEDAEAIIDGDPVYVYTTCLPTAPEQSDGLRFYTLSSSTETSLQFVEIEGAPQADTPYLVAVSSDTEINMSIDESVSVTLKKETDNTNNIGAFKFVGTTTGLTNAEAAAAGAYILQDGNVWGRVTTEHFEAYIPPFRAYIVPAANNARPLLIGAFSDDSGETTTISTMQLTDRDGTTHYFDLNGRRIANPAAKGVYVVNGKKVLIKK